MSDHEKVRGYCPMGCGQTLFVGTDGWLTCSYVKCPAPTAAARLLDENESEHVVTFTASKFTIRHPLRDRLDGILEKCPLHAHLARQSTPPVARGRYRAIEQSGRWTFTRLPR